MHGTGSDRGSNFWLNHFSGRLKNGGGSLTQNRPFFLFAKIFVVYIPTVGHGIAHCIRALLSVLKNRFTG